VPEAMSKVKIMGPVPWPLGPGRKGKAGEETRQRAPSYAHRHHA